MLYLSWRKEKVPLLNFTLYVDAYHMQENILRNNLDRYEHNRDIVQDALEDYTENDPAVDVCDTLNSEAT